MTAGILLDYAIGWIIGFAILAVFMLASLRIWVRRARKLAAQSDIALPEPLADRVARFLRKEMLLSQLASGLSGLSTLTVLRAIGSNGNWAAWLPLILTGLPLCFAAVCCAWSWWPRWKGSADYQVARPGRLLLRRAFTPTEFAAVEAGLLLTVGLEAWGLWYARASPLWWAVCAIALAGAVAVGRSAAERIMSRPLTGADSIELGWDDVLRFRQIRAIIASGVWGTAALVYLADGAVSSAFVSETPIPGGESFQLRWWPIIVPIVIIAVLSRVFRQGRQLWRQAWLDRHG